MSSSSPPTSLYEIHISVFLESGADEVRWMRFCAEQKWHGIRVLNHAGKHNVQNMISYWKHAARREDAVATAQKIGALIRAAGFRVAREKVEAMMSDVSDTLPGDQPSQYWEFHAKLLNASSVADWQALSCFASQTPYVGVSQSVYSRRKNTTIVTIRVPRGTKHDAENIFKKVMKTLTSMGYKTDTNVQCELSVFDTFPELDRDWIRFVVSNESDQIDDVAVRARL